jgi:hypothetical protein
MKTIELVGQVDEQHRLSVEVPADVPPGPVKVIVELPDVEEDEDERSWSRAIAQSWANDWNDPREDIYTMDDGKPSQ